MTMEQVAPTARVTDEVEALRSQLLSISELVRDLAGELELDPLLEKILSRALRLLGYRSGSISLVDERSGTYTKRIDSGVICQEGLTFPITEGFTGMVIRSRQPVILTSYSEVQEKHISRDDPRYDCAVMGVPMIQKNEVIGTLIVFGRVPGETFSEDQARLVELFASQATIALVSSQLHQIASERAKAVAVSEERERATQEFRDTVHTMLTNLLVDMEQVMKKDDNSDDSLQTVISSAREFVREALDSQWNTEAGVLLPQAENLESRIASELAWLETSSGVSSEFHIVGTRRVLATEVEHHCFKVAQEALSNVVKHAQAERVRVGLIFNSGSVSVVIEDNGVGFNVQDVHKTHASLRPKCLGLHDMAARVSRLNGDFSIESTEGWGTTVRAQIFDASHGQPSEAGPPRWKIAIATRMPLISAGLIRLLSLYEPAIQVVAEIHNDDQFEETVNLVKPDIVAVDIAMLEGELLTQLLTIRETMPELPIIAITQNPTTEELYASSRAGVRGFLRADTDPATIVRTIVAAVQANTLLGGGAFENFNDYLSSELLADEPTQREYEVLKILCQGGSNQDIASQLHISIKTVEKHVSALLRKSGAENRTMLANMFLQKLSKF